MAPAYTYQISQQYVTPATLACQPTTINLGVNERWVSSSNGYEVKKPETRKQIKMRQASAFSEFYSKRSSHTELAEVQKKNRAAERKEKLTRPLKYKNLNENLIL